MSTSLVKDEILRFLGSSDPEVFCLKGHWGVGKTFAWNKYLNEAKMSNAIALKRYSYVSLFGLGTLDDLKYAIFENTVQSTAIEEPTLKSLRHNTSAVFEGLGRKATALAQSQPLIQKYIGGLDSVCFLSVRDTIICIDDIERRGKGLDVKDVMGLASHLKERRKCKVFFILNDEALQDHKADFATYYEKVVDASLTFAPTAQECADIAIDSGTDSGKLLAENCILLGISNIRLIKKIERAVSRIEPLLKGLNTRVVHGAIKSLVLFGWSIYEPNRAPSVEFLKARTPANLYGASKSKEMPEQYGAWNALLEVYQFGHLDELDPVLLEGMQRGFFDPEQVAIHAKKLSQEYDARDKDDSFTEAWKLYHDSFEDNALEVIESILASFKANAGRISPTNLSGTVRLFKELGRQDLAPELIATYLTVHAGDPAVFDLSSNVFAGNVTDPDVVTAFKEKHASFKEERDLAALLAGLSKGWGAADISYLAAVSEEDYYKLFKGLRGTELRRAIDGGLQFDRMSNCSEEQKAISEPVKNALRKIATESKINEVRVQKYGVNIIE